MRGVFVAIEGCDGSGKSTQARMAAAALGDACVALRFPDRSSRTGSLIDAHLRGVSRVEPRPLHELFARNRAEASASIRRWLSEGKVVIADRYAHSGLAYALGTGAMEEDEYAAMESEYDTLTPDIVILLDVDPSVARLRREDYGSEAFEAEGVQNAVRKVFSRLAGSGGGGRWIVIPPDEGPERASARILEAISSAR